MIRAVAAGSTLGSKVRACSSTTIPFAHSRPVADAKLDVRHDADADDHRVARKAPAVRRLDRVDASESMQRADRGTDHDLDSAARCRSVKRCRHLLADDPPEHAVGGFEHRDREAAVARPTPSRGRCSRRRSTTTRAPGCKARVERVDVEIVRTWCTPARSAPGTASVRGRLPVANSSLSAQSATVVQA
jgi:hypothetical protein